MENPKLPELWTIADYEAAAREALADPQATPSFLPVRGTQSHNATYENNLRSYEDWYLRPRIMRDVTHRSTAVTVLGSEITLPIIVAPAGGNRRFHDEGEVATARGANEAGTIMSLSTVSSCSIEEVAAATSGPKWFQLYVLKDRKLTESLIRRAEESGYRGLLVTVDNQTYRSPERDARFGRGRVEDNFGNFASNADVELPTADNYWSTEWQAKASDFTWGELGWLRSITSMPIAIKGIQTVEDAVLCVEHKLEGIVVSNHGGYTAQGVPGALTMLAEIAPTVRSDIEIYVDGGIRKGTDVLKALALGARAVLVGRPTLWGLLVDGSKGVAGVYEVLRNELDIAMALCGIVDVRDVPGDLVRRVSEDRR